MVMVVGLVLVVDIRVVVEVIIHKMGEEEVVVLIIMVEYKPIPQEETQMIKKVK